MKRPIRILLFLIIVLPSCKKEPIETGHDQINLEKVILDPFIIQNYYKYAKLLYINEIHEEIDHFNRYDPVIDTAEVTKILKIIQTVYDLNSTESNLIFNEYKIRPAICINLNYLWLEVNKDSPWIGNLCQGIIPTGNQKLDSLLTVYEYKSVKSYTFSKYVIINFNKDYNLIPVASEFLSVPSILDNFWDSCGGDGNDIKIKRSMKSANIVFSIGTGDCPAGCLYHKYWEFEVADSKATFIGSYEE